jgi:hypothetical protein
MRRKSNKREIHVPEFDNETEEADCIQAPRSKICRTNIHPCDPMALQL